ncbi:hypothetical protein V5T82_08105 [Magnetovibrio sp. PR-2]|uniref:hypothetical protein n=1 Tax=Magnetovibrio sp. PR-2 TaxID=3120356 RepID=UPI002FCDE286
MFDLEDDTPETGGAIEVAHRSTAATKTIIKATLDLMMRHALLTRDKKTPQLDEDIKELVREIEVVIRTNLLNHGNEVAEQIRKDLPLYVQPKVEARADVKGEEPQPQDDQPETGNRSKFLLRLIAGRFSHLFADPNQPIFPREVVKGFDDYMIKLLGEVLYGELNIEAQELLSQFSSDDDGEIWKLIGANDRHKRFAYNILIRILMKFEDFDWARRNFVSILNNVTERASGFVFEDKHFQLLFNALFSDLFKALWDDEESLKLDFMFGDGTADRLDGIRDQFKAYRAEIMERDRAQQAVAAG